MYFFDKSTTIEHGLKKTRVNNGIFLTTSVRDLKLKAPNKF